MAISTFFQTTTYRGNFIAGWDKYVEHGGFSLGPHPPPDVFWNPREGQWHTYPAGKWRIVDEGLPSIPQPSFSTNAGNVFDEITQQWSAMAPTQQQTGVWDGRRYRWVLAEPTHGNGNGSCRAHYESVLAFLRQLHADGKLGDEEFKDRQAELFKKYERCLGS